MSESWTYPSPIPQPQPLPDPEPSTEPLPEGDSEIGDNDGTGM